MDIGFSNWSLELISISFHTIIKGTIPAFVLLFALLLGLEERSLPTAVAVLLVCCGISMAASGEVYFSTAGFCFGMASASFAGLRWALLQLLIRGRPTPPVAAADAGSALGSTAAAATDSAAGGAAASAAGSCAASTAAGGAAACKGAASSGNEIDTQAISRHANPLGSVLYMSPPCALAALLLALICEHNIIDSPVLQDPHLKTELLVLLGVMAVLVFIMLLAEFALVQLTSSLTLSILGILKEFVTILMAGWAKGEPLSAMKLTGFLTCSSGAVLYHVIKNRRARTAATKLVSRTDRDGRAWKELHELEGATASPAAPAAPAAVDSTRAQP